MDRFLKRTSSKVTPASVSPGEEPPHKRPKPATTMSASEAKAYFCLTETDLKRLESTKVGSKRHYNADSLLAAALRKHGSEEKLEGARQNAAMLSGKIGGKTLEQHRRALGDEVKKHINVEKWCIAARTHCTTTCNPDVFRKLVVPNADQVTPAEFNHATPVVVANVTKGAASIFGSTKLTGGTRMGSWKADKMELVYFPSTQELRCWWTMS